MSAKQSTILVARTKKRAKAAKLLRSRCAVFNETDRGTSENAPLGWCEIQRDDSAGYFPSDASAARAVALAAGAEGTAMHYEEVTGIMEPINVMSPNMNVSTRATHAAIYARDESEDDAPSWICIVPRVVARAAGLIKK